MTRNSVWLVFGGKQSIIKTCWCTNCSTILKQSAFGMMPHMMAQALGSVTVTSPWLQARLAKLNGDPLGSFMLPV